MHSRYKDLGFPADSFSVFIANARGSLGLIAMAGNKVRHGPFSRIYVVLAREAKEKNRESWYMAYIMDTNDEERAKGKTVEVRPTEPMCPCFNREGRLSDMSDSYANKPVSCKIWVRFSKW